MSEEKIKWCLSKRQGIELVEPNENLVQAYLFKADAAFSALRLNKGNSEWEITTAYYLMYFSAYAILMKAGIKCEIHSCTIEVLRLFSDLFSPDELVSLAAAKVARERVQYHVVESKELIAYFPLIAAAKKFHVACRRVLADPAFPAKSALVRASICNTLSGMRGRKSRSRP